MTIPALEDEIVDEAEGPRHTAPARRRAGTSRSSGREAGSTGAGIECVEALAAEDRKRNKAAERTRDPGRRLYMGMVHDAQSATLQDEGDQSSPGVPIRDEHAHVEQCCRIRAAGHTGLVDLGRGTKLAEDRNFAIVDVVPNRRQPRESGCAEDHA